MNTLIPDRLFSEGAAVRYRAAMTHSNSLSASKSADLADDLASTAAYVRARHGSAYGLTAANVSDRRIGVLTLTVPADDALCCLGCCD